MTQIGHFLTHVSVINHIGANCVGYWTHLLDNSRFRHSRREREDHLRHGRVGGSGVPEQVLSFEVEDGETSDASVFDAPFKGRSWPHVFRSLHYTGEVRIEGIHARCW
jgi:hypothetical protein